MFGVTTRGAVMGVTVRWNVCGRDRAMPPWAVPPLSCTCTVNVEDPKRLGARAYVRVPLASTAGRRENRPGLLTPVTVYVAVWLTSFAPGPGLKPAQPGTTWAPLFSTAIWSLPVKLGWSLTKLTVMGTDAVVLCGPPSCEGAPSFRSMASASGPS